MTDQPANRKIDKMKKMIKTVGQHTLNTLICTRLPSKSSRVQKAICHGPTNTQTDRHRDLKSRVQQQKQQQQQ